MTELYIDGTSVVLPEGFSVTIKRENPFFTKNGEYTYDITLSLDNATNSKLYKFLNRLNSVEDVKSKRPAILIADNRVYCNGTEVITGWTDKQVNIQLVSGNSELNYLIGADELISSLSMPETNPVSNGTVSLKYITDCYPAIDFNLMMTYDRTNDTDKNKWILNRVEGGSATDSEVKPQKDIKAYDYIPQPYLCAYIREIIKALGYSLTYNAIENTAWKDAYIVHVYPTYKWAEMIPGWTIKEFLEEVEKLFNVSFFIDSRKKTVQILLNNNFITQSGSVHITNVEDEYTVECEEEPDADVLHSNLKYAFPNNSYFKMRAIPDIVWQAAKHKTVEGELYTFFQKPENQVTDTIFYYPKHERHLIYLGGELISVNLEYVNEFATLLRENATSDLEFALIPAELTERKMLWDMESEVLFSEYYIPTTDSQGGNDSQEEYDTIHDMVDNLQEKSESKNNVFLAFYSGLNTMSLGFIEANAYPLAYTEKYYPVSNTSVPVGRDDATFRLEDMEDIFYSHGYDIDYKNPVKITSWDPNLFNLQSVVEIRNKRYLCKEVEYTLDANGRSKPWTGIFYPCKISDTEAEVRWILADGKWRDGGVWLDNGRWLDE